MEKTVNIEDLIQDNMNLNKGTEAGQKLMEKSFKELGAGRSILVDKDGRIIAGNKSQRAAMAAGIQKVRVIETTGDELIAVKRTDLSLDSREGRELAYVDNLTTQVNLAWDEIEIEHVQTEVEGFDMNNWGVPEGLQLENPVEDKEVEEDDFDEEKEEIPTICQTGDVWALGEHRLMCGDSTKAKDVEMLMNGEQADLWLTDPPYNVDYSAKVEMLNEYMKKIGEYKLGGVDRPIENDVMPSAKFFSFLVDAFTPAYSVMKKGCPFYVWFSSREHVNFETALNKVGLSVRQEIIWNKREAVLSRQDYQWKHEPCLYGWKEGAGHYFIDLRNQRTVIDDEAEIDLNKMKKDELKNLCKELMERPREETVIIEANLQRNHLHPTMKPVKLFGRLVRNSSRPGERVLDTFGGSGTTLIACEQLGRKARLMELDPHYCDVIIARWEKLTGKKATKL